MNEWGSGSGDALNPPDIEAAIIDSMPDEPGWARTAGLDLGLARDGSAFVVVGRHVGHTVRKRRPARRLTSAQRALVDAGIIERPPAPAADVVHHEGTGRYRVASVQVWKPERGRRVELEPIEHAIVAAHRRFRFGVVAYDPFQAEYLAERLRKQGVPVEPVQFVPQNLTRMCATVLAAFGERAVDIPRDPDLVRDLQRMRVVERQWGVRLDFPRGADGHGDAATAMAIGMLVARRLRTPARVRGRLVCHPAA